MPEHDLSKVKQLAAEQALELDGSRCLPLMTPYIDPLRCHEFACELVALLTPGDFRRSVQVGKFLYDEYVLRLPDEVLVRFGGERLKRFATWLVKFRISPRGGCLFFISCHGAERSALTVGGVVKVQFGGD